MFRGILRNAVPRVSSLRSQTLQIHAGHALNTIVLVQGIAVRIPMVPYFRDLNLRLARSVHGVHPFKHSASKLLIEKMTCSMQGRGYLYTVAHLQLAINLFLCLASCPSIVRMRTLYRGRYFWSSAMEKWTEGRNKLDGEIIYLSGAKEILGLFRHQ